MKELINEHKEAIVKNQKAIFLLESIIKIKEQKAQFELKIDIESKKPYLESFLVTPKSYYEKEIERCDYYIDNLINRYEAWRFKMSV